MEVHKFHGWPENVPIWKIEERFVQSEIECPICGADIPLEGDERAGDLVVCSYCSMTIKLLRKDGNWVPSEDFDE